MPFAFWAVSLVATLFDTNQTGVFARLGFEFAQFPSQTRKLTLELPHFLLIVLLINCLHPNSLVWHLVCNHESENTTKPGGKP